MDQRPTGKLSFKDEGEIASAAMEAPAYVSAYLNMRATAAYVSQSSAGNTGLGATMVDLDGAVRVGFVVLEGEGSLYAGAAAGLTQANYQDFVLYRRGTRFVYDLPEEATRIRLGDIMPDYSGFQSSPDILGLSVQKTYMQLQPGKSIHPTGSHSFRVERPSSVDIIVDGVLFRHIKIEPGNYDLSELPLRPGASKVKLVIADDTGARQTLEFTAFSGAELLAPGISEWSFNAGIRSFDQGVVDQPSAPNTTIAGKTQTHSYYAQRQYYFDRPVATGYYRTGITTAVTIDTNAQADDKVAMAGAGFATQTIAGLFWGEAAGSQTFSGGTGYAVRLGYGYDRWDWFGYKSVFRLLGEYRSQDFNTVGTFSGPAIYNTSVAASYSQHLPYNITAGLSLSYYLLDESSVANPTGGGERWEADLSLSKQLWTDIAGSVSAGYRRDQTADTGASGISNQNGFQALVRLAWTPELTYQRDGELR